MGSAEALIAGASIGLAIAAPVGPMAVIVVRRTMAGGFLAGIATGAGASTVNLFYATLAICGIDQAATRVDRMSWLLNVLTAVILLFSALKMLRPHSAGDASPAAPGRSFLANYVSAVALNSFNPIGFALLLGALAAVARMASGGGGEPFLLGAGVFLGSIGWWTCLVSAIALIGLRLSPQWVRRIDIAAGLVMLVLAVSTMSRVI